MTLFEGPAVAGGKKIHDFHPAIAPSGLYWVAPVPKGGLVLSDDARQARLELVATVIDQPGWPDYDAQFVPAAMSLKVVWKATGEKIVVEDTARHFRFEGYRAIAQAEAKVSVPSLNFSWKSDPIETSRADFAVIGTEINGKYFDERKKG